jgi:hypothetical protein
MGHLDLDAMTVKCQANRGPAKGRGVSTWPGLGRNGPWYVQGGPRLSGYRTVGSHPNAHSPVRNHWSAGMSWFTGNSTASPGESVTGLTNR